MIWLSKLQKIKIDFISYWKMSSITLTSHVAKNIIRKLLKWEDYRIEVVSLINAEFLQYSIDFFKKVVEAKFKNKDITVDWYKKEFLNESLSSNEIAINSWLNKKTISNMYNSWRREIVIEASNQHYDALYESIKNLVESDDTVDMQLTLKFKWVSVDLTVNETLIVINTLAVKRAALRWWLWSTAGKRVEKPLMEIMCKIYWVNEKNYNVKSKNDQWDLNFDREIDFYLIAWDVEHKCEVKLMWKWNPESADAVIARDSKVFVADKLSDTNKAQLDHLGVEWVELRNEYWYRKFWDVLNSLSIENNWDPNFNEDEIVTFFDEILS